MTRNRVYRLSDGRIEVRRVLNDESMREWSHDQPLAFEKSIVWLERLDGLDYVRSAVVNDARSRRGPLSSPGVMVLGYSKLTADAPRNPHTGHYTRRVFYLKPADTMRNLNDVPEGAVDPRTVAPGVTGRPPLPADFFLAYPVAKGLRPRDSKAQATMSRATTAPNEPARRSAHVAISPDHGAVPNSQAAGAPKATIPPPLPATSTSESAAAVA